MCEDVATMLDMKVVLESVLTDGNVTQGLWQQINLEIITHWLCFTRVQEQPPQ